MIDVGKSIDCTYPTCDLYADSAVTLCDAHKWRRRNGKDMDAPVARLLPRGTGLAERLYARLDISGGPDACWEWTGHRRKRRSRGLAYARMCIGGNATDYVHRVSYVVHIGPIPDGMLVCHSCDNPSCGNPAHLFLGTTQDNTADKVAKGRQLRGQRHPRAKLSAADVKEIRATPNLEDLAVRSALAERFGVTQPAIENVARGRSWRELY